MVAMDVEPAPVPTSAPPPTLASPGGARPTSGAYQKPLREVGAFFALSLDILMQTVRPPFAWRVHPPDLVCGSGLDLPGHLLGGPAQRAADIHHQRLAGRDRGADASGTGAALASVVYIGPIAAVLVVAGTGATAMCADLGARTIREELDAMRVMGIDPIQRLLVPRVLALGLNGMLLNSIITTVGLVTDYFSRSTSKMSILVPSRRASRCSSDLQKRS